MVINQTISKMLCEVYMYVIVIFVFKHHLLMSLCIQDNNGDIALEKAETTKVQRIRSLYTNYWKELNVK